MEQYFFDGCGTAGVICFLIAYFFLEKGTLHPHSYGYLGLNLVGAILHLISITHDWNLASFMLECAWVSISAYGIHKAYRKGSAA